jgi:hypothetical protein
MSIWAEIRRRGIGSEIKKEDDIRIQWIRQMMEHFPESEFRKLYQDDIFPIVDYTNNIKPNNNLKPFEPIVVKWWGDHKFDHKDFWK